MTKAITTPNTVMATVDGTDIKLKLMDCGWVRGTLDGHRFLARVSNYDSDFGIEEGRVYTLEIRQIAKAGSKGMCIVNYDRGWNIRPEPRDFAVYEKVLRALDTVPLRAEHELDADLSARNIYGG